MAFPLRTAARAVLGKKGTGYHPSPTDERDGPHAFRTPLTFGAPGERKILAGADELVPHVAVRDQGSTESCTAHVVDYGVQALCGARLGPGRRVYTPRSVASPYWHGRAINGLENRDRGAVFRSVLKAYAYLGAPPESAWPLRLRTINNQPGADAYRLGRGWRGLQYARIEGDPVEGALEALSAGYPVALGIPLDQMFFEDDAPDVIVSLGPTVAYHAVALAGFSRTPGLVDSVRFMMPNSWGTRWRDNGWCRLGPGVVSQALEAWALTGFRA